MDKPWVSNYKEMRYEFIDESDAEYLEKTVPNYSKYINKGCPTCLGKKRYFFQGIDHVCHCDSQLNLYKHYTNANIGLNYQRLDWADYQGSEVALSTVSNYLQYYEGMVREGFGILMSGSTGLGKTMLSSLVAKELIQLGYSVYFSTFSEMTTLLTKGWGNSEAREFFEKKVVRSDVFILDDIGKEFRTKTNLAESTFDHVLRSRIANCRPVFITTNLSLDEMKHGYGAPIFSLLREKSSVINMEGPDYRTSRGDSALEQVMNGETRPIF